MVFGILFLTWMLSSVTNTVCIWGLFVMVTVIGVWVLSISGAAWRSIFWYFVFQELFGLVFVLGLSSYTQIVSLLIKGGFAPFHWWLVKVVEGSTYYSFVFLMSVQKVPYNLIVSSQLNGAVIWFLVLFIWVPLISAQSSWGLITLFLVITSSSSYILVFSNLSGSVGCFLIVVYSLFVYLSLGLFSVSGQVSYSYEFAAFLTSLPLTLSIILKVWIILMVSSSLLVVVLLVTLLYSLVGSLSILMNLYFVDYFPASFDWLGLFLIFLVSFILL